MKRMYDPKTAAAANIITAPRSLGFNWFHSTHFTVIMTSKLNTDDLISRFV